MWVIYIKTPKDYYLIHQLVQLTDLILKELFVTEEIPITVSRRAPDPTTIVLNSYAGIELWSANLIWKPILCSLTSRCKLFLMIVSSK